MSKLKGKQSNFPGLHGNGNLALQELEDLANRKSISFDEAEAFKEKFQYEPLNHYLNSLLNKVKPETATGELFQSLMKDLLGERAFSEVSQKKGFVDFAIQENKVNPLSIELKPFLKLRQKQKQLKPDELVYLEHKQQIKKYLVENEFIILTNLKDAYLFNREALIDFKPFAEITFPELLKKHLHESPNSLWDTVRRLEDSTYKPELDDEFLRDLKKWYAELESNITLEVTDEFKKRELIVLFLNKIIFIKTLEDYGLIPFKFLVDQYTEAREKWETKGVKNIFKYFFFEIENWFWEYYDTELFQTNFWDYLEKSEENLSIFQDRFEKILGIGDKWTAVFKKGMIHYNYREIDEDVFGKAYETFIAETRKDTGIYYTPRSITNYMVKKLVKDLFEEPVESIRANLEQGAIEKAKTQLSALGQNKVIDTAAGSGSFLIKVIREIYGYYKLLMDDTEWVEHQQQNDLLSKPKFVTDTESFRKFALFDSENKRRLVSSLILRHIYGIDLDERALETAKTNIWKEAIKLNPPLFNYRHLNEKFSHILPNLEMNFKVGDALVDLPLVQQVNLLAGNYTEEIRQMQEIRNNYLSNPSSPDILQKLEPIKERLREDLAEKLSFNNKPVFVALEFFHAYFQEDGSPLEKSGQGFDGLVSNPPWEEIYPVKKEFAEVGKYTVDKETFEKQFDKWLKTYPEFAEKWDAYKYFYEDYTNFISNRFGYHKEKPATSKAMRSHLNYFKVFFERDVEILKNNGLLSILVPSSFQTDEGSYGLRRLSIVENKLLEITSFDNRGYLKENEHRKLFPDVHPQFKFSFVYLEKTAPHKDYTFNSRFYLVDPERLKSNNFTLYNQEKVEHFSPYALSLMEFGSERDRDLCEKIKGTNHVLLDKDYLIRREFNVSDDRKLFKNKKGKGLLPVYEGKNIHQFNINFSPISKFADEEAAHENLLNKEIGRIKKNLKVDKNKKALYEEFEEKGYQLDYQTYRLTFRAIGRSTDERTLIASLQPRNTFSVNSLNYIVNQYYTRTKKENKEEIEQKALDNREILYLLSLFNSLTINYYLRNKVSANLNMFYIYELPIPEIYEKQKGTIAEKAFSLLQHKAVNEEFEELKNQLNFKNADISNPIQLRAELEVIVAKEVFGLNKKDWEYLTSTFVYGGESTTKQELDEIIQQSNAIF